MKTFFIISLALLIFSISIVYINFNNDNRQLTKREIKELRSVFFKDVDYSKVVISTANLPPTMAAFVFGNQIIFREEYYIADFSKNYLKMARLVHETGHVWGNQSKGFQTSLAAIVERVIHKDQVYAHDPLSNNNSDNKALHTFRYEQQCRILSDYYTNRHLKLDISAYEKTIYKTITRP